MNYTDDYFNDRPAPEFEPMRTVEHYNLVNARPDAEEIDPDLDAN